MNPIFFAAIGACRRASGSVEPKTSIAAESNGLRKPQYGVARGGVDKCCRAIVELRRPGTVAVTSHHGNLLAAVDLATQRARRIILKRSKRRTIRWRKPLAMHGNASDGSAFTEAN